MKVYDCFSFFNELDLLEIRLNELDSVIDVFVLVEATWTHQNKEKPLYYNLNKERFSKFHSKIRHIVLTKKPSFFYSFRKPKSWDFERFQKDQIKMGLYDCLADDLIILSDVDEIPNPKKILENKNRNGVSVFEQSMYYYFLNCLEVTATKTPKWWYGTTMTPFENFKTGNKLRMLREIHKYLGTHIIQDGGWHFSYIGGVEKIIEKIESFAHVEFNKDDLKKSEKIKALIESGKNIYGQEVNLIFGEIDKSFPQFIQNNKNKFQEYIFDQVSS